MIAFYNPVSARRRELLGRARDILLEHRPASTPVVLGRNLGRPDAATRLVPLAELDADQCDMLTHRPGRQQRLAPRAPAAR